MKVMTFNVQHCIEYLKNEISYEAIANVIKRVKPDVVALNEMYDDDEKSKYGSQVEKLSKLTGMKHYYFAKAIETEDGPYGNAILSKYVIKNPKVLIIPNPKEKRNKNGYYEQRCVLKATIKKNIRILITHFGLNIDEQENALETLLKNIKDKKCILMGDFNIEPDHFIIERIRDRMKDASIGFCENEKTWPSDKPKVKIDYIFTSKDINIESSSVPDLVASDHRPHVATLEI